VAHFSSSRPVGIREKELMAASHEEQKRPDSGSSAEQEEQRTTGRESYPASGRRLAVNAAAGQASLRSVFEKSCPLARSGWAESRAVA